MWELNSSRFLYSRFDIAIQFCRSLKVITTKKFWRTKKLINKTKKFLDMLLYICINYIDYICIFGEYIWQRSKARLNFGDSWKLQKMSRELHTHTHTYCLTDYCHEKNFNKRAYYKFCCLLSKHILLIVFIFLITYLLNYL